MTPTSKADWKSIFEAGYALDAHAAALMVLDHLDGYGWDYGFDAKTDAHSLLNAMEVIREMYA